jgi:hypothetical protein
MIGADLAIIGGLGEGSGWLYRTGCSWSSTRKDPDDDNGWLYGFALLYSAPQATPPPDPAVAPEQG